MCVSFPIAAEECESEEKDSVIPTRFSHPNMHYEVIETEKLSCELARIMKARDSCSLLKTCKLSYY